MSFECKADKFEVIDSKKFVENGISFPNVHTDLDQMVSYSLLVKESKGDCFASVPFCVTVEAESLGADINLGDENLGPRSKEYFIDDAKDIYKIGKHDFSVGRMSTVLHAVEKLSDMGETVALNVEGPITIAMQLMDSSAFYKALRKDENACGYFVEAMSNNIFEYIREGSKRGAKIISFADPSGDIKIVGPKLYKSICEPVIANVLGRIKREIKGVVVHICGKTSTALESKGAAEIEKVDYQKDKSYGRAICDMFNENEAIFIGHRCIKTSGRIYENPIMFVLGLK